MKLLRWFISLEIAFRLALSHTAKPIRSDEKTFLQNRWFIFFVRDLYWLRMVHIEVHYHISIDSLICLTRFYQFLLIILLSCMYFTANCNFKCRGSSLCIHLWVTMAYVDMAICASWVTWIVTNTKMHWNRYRQSSRWIVEGKSVSYSHAQQNAPKKTTSHLMAHHLAIYYRVKCTHGHWTCAQKSLWSLNLRIRSLRSLYTHSSDSTVTGSPYASVFFRLTSQTMQPRPGDPPVSGRRK